MKILVLAPNYIMRTNWGHQLWRNEIARQHDVVFHGDGHDLQGYRDVLELEEKFGPFDVITMGENPRHFSQYENIDRCRGIKVAFVCDYFAQKEMEYNRLVNKHACDIVFLMSRDCLRRFRKTQSVGGIKEAVESHWLPWTVDTDVFKCLDLPKQYEVMCVYGLFDPVYPKRPKLQQMVENMPSKTLVSNWTKGNIKHERYVRAINESKIFVSVNGINNELTMKYMECLACGTLFMTNEPNDFSSYGFKADWHMVTYQELEQVPELVKYYLDRPDERTRIARTGMEFVRSNYSNRQWIEEWTLIIEQWRKDYAVT